MKKKKADEGLRYIQKLGIRAAKSANAIYSSMVELAGEDDAVTYIKTVLNLSRTDLGESYEFQNSDFEKCMIFSGGYDADIIRKTANWIIEHRDAFGKKILDAGCGNGMITCFLALTFPDSEILAIDKGANTIAMAEQVAEKLGVSNVTFKQCSLAELEEKEFDTVFSMRMIFENRSSYEPEDLIRDLDEQANIYRESLNDYAAALVEKLTDGGTLISIERGFRNAFLLGWFQAAQDAGLGFRAEDYRPLLCSEITDVITLHTLIGKKGDAGAEPTDVYWNACEEFMDLSQDEFGGWDAKSVLHFMKGDMISGYLAEDTVTGSKSKVSVWTHKNDPAKLILFRVNQDIARTQYIDIDKKEELLTALDEEFESSLEEDTLSVEKL